MINNDVANQLQLLIKAVAPPLIEVADTPLESPKWVPGQRLQAVVLASLPNERFQVMVSDQELDMNLPRNTQPGDKLELVFVSSQPRPTFVLTRDIPLAQGPQTDAKLSQTARFLGALLRGDLAATGKEQAAAVARTLPILPGPPDNVSDLAMRLGKALSNSGLFYESHQAQWMAGQRPLAELLQEPQGKLSPRLVQSEALPAPVLKEASTQQMASVPVTDRMPARDLVHPQATGLVQQQLEVLDGRHMIWQGQVWPGQAMEWRVEERDARQGEDAPADVTEWQTSLRLHMPHLGNIDAVLNLSPKGVQLRLTAGVSATASVMKDRQEDLYKSMEASGLKILAFAVDVADG